MSHKILKKTENKTIAKKSIRAKGKGRIPVLYVPENAEIKPSLDRGAFIVGQSGELYPTKIRVSGWESNEPTTIDVRVCNGKMRLINVDDLRELKRKNILSGILEIEVNIIDVTTKGMAICKVTNGTMLNGTISLHAQ